MRLKGFCRVAAALILFALINVSGSELEPLKDPISAKIQKGDLVVGATEFIRVPQTSDSSERGANEAYARIQSLMPVGDGSGRLILNDLRGLLYMTDENGKAPVTYLDIRGQGVGFDDSMFPNETGLAGFAFHPQFSNEGQAGFGRFYTAYSTQSDNGNADYLNDDSDSHESVIREWTADDPSADIFSGTAARTYRLSGLSD